MSIVKKLQIQRGQTIWIINAPTGFELDAPTSDKADASALLFFAYDSKSLRESGKPAIAAAKQDRLSWIAYPKAGRLGTDLNRDKLRDFLAPHGIQPVRLVSLDETWSAMRFRPAL